ncbi:hypothetical protein SEPCBS57363_006836, partial [Sporothrix epigloea]
VRKDWMKAVLLQFRAAKSRYATDENKVIFAFSNMESDLVEEFTAFAMKQPVEEGVEPEFSWKVFDHWFHAVGEKKESTEELAVRDYK